jgi:hypothetical protein
MKFSLIFFFIGLVTGFIVTNLKSLEITKIIKYPNPFNTENLVYQGLSGDCYKVTFKNVKCTSKVIKQPII